jgi:hypothetical protein
VYATPFEFNMISKIIYNMVLFKNNFDIVIPDYYKKMNSKNMDPKLINIYEALNILWNCF